MLHLRSSLSALVLATASLATAQSISLMPLPQHMQAGTGSLAIDSTFQIRVAADSSDETVQSAAQRLQAALAQSVGHPVALTQSTATEAQPDSLSIVVDHAVPTTIGADESYTLDIGPNGALLKAATSLGAVRGLATVRQLIPLDGSQSALPAVHIEDAPLYAWRGVMVDSARHFLPMDVMERTLDAMELVKLNVLHFHLSDNEGFRVESKAFPKLQQQGSGGEFYTQAELRKLIHDAAIRGIVVVPEFDMPSHAISWLAGYPELSASPGPFTPGPPIPQSAMPKRTGTEDVKKFMATAKFPAFDPTREATYAFLDRFIAEMTELFPAPYFHIGADENNGAVWLANPAIVSYMHAHNIATAEALQAYFVSRVRTLVAAHNRTMVAWEEAYAENATAGSIYQVWSPLAKLDLLKTQLPPKDRLLVSKGFYLDLFYPAYVHYSSDTLPLTGRAASPVLGGEAAMWTEMEDRTDIEARMWPRTGPMAERFWTAGPIQSPNELYTRLFRLGAVLDRAGIHGTYDYEQGVKKLAANGDIHATRTLLDVLVPLKGYKRAMQGGRKPAGVPLDDVADVILVDSQAKYRFRAAVESFLKQHDAASAQELRTWLTLWQQNDASLKSTFAQSPKLSAVAGQSQRLSALSAFTLQVMDKLQQSQPLTTSEMATAEKLILSAQAKEGQTEIAVEPEIAGLLHGALQPEPTSYALF